MTSNPKKFSQDCTDIRLITTGVIVGDRIYCLANSQLENLNQETNEIIDTSALNYTFIIGVPLK